MLPQLHAYMLSHWEALPDAGPPPRHLAFVGQATGVSKACFFVLVDDQPTPRYIVKTPRSPLGNARLAQEVATIERVRRSVPPHLLVTLPGPMHTATLDGQLVVIEPILPGRPMDSATPERQPLDRAAAVQQISLAYAWLVGVQREAEHVKQPLSAHALHEFVLAPLERLRAHTDLTADEARYVDRLEQEARALQGVMLPLYLYHGDFRAGNILIDHGRIAVLDWEFSQSLNLPLLDWFSFVFRLYSRSVGLADIDGSLPTYRAVFDEVFRTRTWFSELVTHYTHAYCRALDIDEALLPLLFDLFVVTNINKFHDFLAERARHGYLYLLQDAPIASAPYQQQLRRQAYVWLLGDLAAGAHPFRSQPLEHAPTASPALSLGASR
jgi:hypothetical protein